MDRDPPSFDSHPDIPISHSSSLSSGLGDSSSLQSFNRPHQSPALSLRSSASRSSMSIPDIAMSAPPSRSTSNTNFAHPRPLHAGSSNGYTPSNTYLTRHSYRQQQYPTLSPGSVAESPGLDTFPTPFVPVHTPVVIHHKILVESPQVGRVTPSSQSLLVSHRPALSPVHPPRSSSWDRNRVHGVTVRRSPGLSSSSPGAEDVKYATLETRKSRMRPPPQWQVIDFFQYIKFLKKIKKIKKI